jgi:hypothetical protein
MNRVIPATLQDAVSPYMIRKDKINVEIEDKMTDSIAGSAIREFFTKPGAILGYGERLWLFSGS